MTEPKVDTTFDDLFKQFEIADETFVIHRGTQAITLRTVKGDGALKQLNNEAALYAQSQARVKFTPEMPGYVEGKEKASASDHISAYLLQQIFVGPELTLPEAYRIVLSCGGLAGSIIAEWRTKVQDKEALAYYTAMETIKKKLEAPQPSTSSSQQQSESTESPLVS